MKDTHGNWHLDGTSIYKTGRGGDGRGAELMALVSILNGSQRSVEEAEALAARIFSAMISEGIA